MLDVGWRMKYEEGFCQQTNKQTEICDCRVAFVTENQLSVQYLKENMMIKDTLISIMQFLSCQFYIFHTSHTFIQ